MGFFTHRQVQSISRPDGKTYSCASCGLYKNKLTPRMKPFGGFKKGILNIGEFPDETDDRKGKQWQGRTGVVLKQAYKKLGVDLFEDCLNINAVNCRPVDGKGNTRNPTSEEIASCRPRVLKYIQEYKPKKVIMHGEIALQSLIGYRWKKNLGKIFKWRGWGIPDRDLKTWLYPVFHPSYIMQQEKNRASETIWMQDLKQALDDQIPFPDFPEEADQVELVEFRKDVKDLLRMLLSEKKPMAFDIECSGLKPHRLDEHVVACISFCNSMDKVYVIPAPDRRMKNQELKDLLESPDIGKIASNMKFEDTWINVYYRMTVNYWLWDTMLASHVIDNRPGITGLKFQTYAHFGVVDYDSEIRPYLTSNSKDANATNKIKEVMQNPELFRKLKIYCGLDSIFEYRLAMKQMGEIL